MRSKNPGGGVTGGQDSTSIALAGLKSKLVSTRSTSFELKQDSVLRNSHDGYLAGKGLERKALLLNTPW
jgi:hypothetical protein